MYLRYFFRLLSVIWIFALIITCAYSIKLVRPYLPIINATLENREILIAESYNYGSMLPISLGEIKNLDKAYFQLKLRFRADSTEGYPNIFQTAPVNRGMRMEISGATATIIVHDLSSPNGLLLLTLTTALKTGQWYSLEVEALNGTFVRAKLNGKSVAAYTGGGLSMETYQILVGGGFDASRVFQGQIEDVSVIKGNFPKRAYLNMFYFVILIGLLALLIKFFQERNAIIPNTKILLEYSKHNDWLKYLSFLLIAAFCFTMLTAYYFPLYSDEIQVRYWLSRLPYDFPNKITGSPRCWSTFFMPIPETMYLPGLINWVIHGTTESPTSLRQVGLIFALLWVMGLTFYLFTKTKYCLVQGVRQIGNGILGLYITGFIISLFAIGVFPIFLVINRSEQLILPSVILLITVFLVSDQIGAKCSLWQKLGLFFLYIISVSLVLYGHAKGVFITPLFVIVGWQLCSHFKFRVPFFFAVMLLLAAQVAQAVFTWKYAFLCSEMPGMEQFLRSFSIDPISLFYDPLLFFDQTYHSLIRFPEYIQKLGFQEWSQVNYLPNSPLSVFAKIANILLGINAVIIFLGLMILLPYQYSRKDFIAGRFITVNLALLTLFVCMLISGVFNLTKHWYDAGYLYALMMIILIFFIGENYSGKLYDEVGQKIFFYLGAVALLSQVIFVDRNLSAFMNGYVGPGIQIGKYESENLHDDLVAVSRTCDLDPVNSKKLVVDDFTYGYFKKSKWPMAISYIWVNNDKESIDLLFSMADSGGMAVYCSSVPDQFKPFVKKEGNICCMSKNQLKNVLQFQK
jgi:hypothetical protein